MKVIDIKAFRKANNLTQSQLGDYLGYDKGFISAIEHGKSKFPKAKLTLLLNNPHNWDTSMLVEPEESVIPQSESVLELLVRRLMRENDDFKSEIEILRNKVHDLEIENENLKIRDDLARKGEIAPIAVGSSDADVV